MKMKFKTIILRALPTAILLLSVVNSFAQPSSGPPPGGGGSTGTTPPCWDPSCIPVDGGIGFLIAAGAFIGIRKIYGRSK